MPAASAAGATSLALGASLRALLLSLFLPFLPLRAHAAPGTAVHHRGALRRSTAVAVVAVAHACTLFGRECLKALELLAQRRPPLRGQRLEAPVGLE